jgi:hypothetical protein
MKLFVKLCLLSGILGAAGPISAQSDSIRLACPLDQAIIIPPNKNAMHYDPPDLCIVLTSMPDTVVKACINGRITNVEQNDEGSWDVVFFMKDYKKNKDYYFWYIGLKNVIVRRNDNVKTGQAIGYIASGEKIEMLMYQFETQVDPSRYMDCSRVLKAF